MMIVGRARRTALLLALALAGRAGAQDAPASAGEVQTNFIVDTAKRWGGAVSPQADPLLQRALQAIFKKLADDSRSLAPAGVQFTNRLVIAANPNDSLYRSFTSRVGPRKFENVTVISQGLISKLLYGDGVSFEDGLQAVTGLLAREVQFTHDEMDREGLAQKYGSVAWQDRVSRADADALKVLRKAGFPPDLFMGALQRIPVYQDNSDNPALAVLGRIPTKDVRQMIAGAAVTLNERTEGDVIDPAKIEISPELAAEMRVGKARWKPFVSTGPLDAKTPGRAAMSFTELKESLAAFVAPFRGADKKSVIALIKEIYKDYAGKAREMTALVRKTEPLSDQISGDQDQLAIAEKVLRDEIGRVAKLNHVTSSDVQRFVTELKTIMPRKDPARDKLIERYARQVLFKVKSRDDLALLEFEKSDNWQRLPPGIVNMASGLGAAMSDMNREVRGQLIRYLAKPNNGEFPPAVVDVIEKKILKSVPKPLMPFAGPTVHESMVTLRNDLTGFFKNSTSDMRAPFIDMALLVGDQAPGRSRAFYESAVGEFLDRAHPPGELGDAAPAKSEIEKGVLALFDTLPDHQLAPVFSKLLASSGETAMGAEASQNLIGPALKKAFQKLHTYFAEKANPRELIDLDRRMRSTEEPIRATDVFGQLRIALSPGETSALKGLSMSLVDKADAKSGMQVNLGDGSSVVVTGDGDAAAETKSGQGPLGDELLKAFQKLRAYFAQKAALGQLTNLGRQLKDNNTPMRAIDVFDQLHLSLSPAELALLDGATIEELGAGTVKSAFRMKLRDGRSFVMDLRKASLEGMAKMEARQSAQLIVNARKRQLDLPSATEGIVAGSNVQVQREADLRNDVAGIEMLKDCYQRAAAKLKPKYRLNVRLPEPINGLGAHKEVIFMEEMPGKTLDNFPAATENRVGAFVAALNVLVLFECKRINPDIHVGNMHYDPLTETVGFFDTGAAVEVDADQLRTFAHFLGAGAFKDGYSMAKYGVNMHEQGLSADQIKAKINKIAPQVEKILKSPSYADEALRTTDVLGVFSKEGIFFKDDYLFSLFNGVMTPVREFKLPTEKVKEIFSGPVSDYMMSEAEFGRTVKETFSTQSQKLMNCVTDFFGKP